MDRPQRSKALTDGVATADVHQRRMRAVDGAGDREVAAQQRVDRDRQDVDDAQVEHDLNFLVHAEQINFRGTRMFLKVQASIISGG